jgi:hypothetical protein
LRFVRLEPYYQIFTINFVLYVEVIKVDNQLQKRGSVVQPDMLLAVYVERSLVLKHKS